MLCAISGESPQDPVISSKSGNVFERRLIEAYISENGSDPITNEELTVDDLIAIKPAHVVRPRPPTFTSIPSLLSVFQNEWDALALDSYNIRQQLTQMRQELSTALYQHDAAVRVIARLTRERDDARDALSKITITSGTEAASNGDSMQVDSVQLPDDLAEKVDETKKKLSKSRRKRPIPKNWASAEDIESFNVLSTSDLSYPGSRSIAVDGSGELAIVGGSGGNAGIYSLRNNNIIATLQVGGGAVTDVAWYGTHPVISTSSGAVKIFKDGEVAAAFASHAGSANALALHPSGEILASVGADKSFVFYDLVNSKSVSQVYTDSELTTAAFHPDGHLLAAGGADGQVKMYHVNNGEFAADFDNGGPIQAISFSENGVWFSTATRGSNNVITFDLRKTGEAAVVKAIDIGSRVENVQWDYTGQFLATAGPSGVTVQQYTKSSKKWSEPKRSAVPAAAVAWGENGRNLVSTNEDGIITVLGSK